MLCKPSVHDFGLRINVGKENGISHFWFHVHTCVSEISMAASCWGFAVCCKLGINRR